jgi:hypothetical protein
LGVLAHPVLTAVWTLMSMTQWYAAALNGRLMSFSFKYEQSAPRLEQS